MEKLNQWLTERGAQPLRRDIVVEGMTLANGRAVAVVRYPDTGGWVLLVPPTTSNDIDETLAAASDLVDDD